jgi:hypothetical protein
MEVGSMTDLSPLSPAAQAVWNAANNSSAYGPEDCLNEARQIAAAALRALAVRINGADAIRQDVLDIAAELENQ